ncbi:hypothetical protein B0T14DRAFT_569215 [Immersiella caudata]|uniref:Heterokaryon incompatibility domain-containing protein n=1 Tax=Immersiella caudata TaxID=314043 RepID=A0AA40BXU7_9PEZI|nr:hypothetical protein B0T14DRAFT_569215 [Immersiella caudata]
MADIYRGASRVVVWLGPCNSGDFLLLGLWQGSILDLEEAENTDPYVALETPGIDSEVTKGSDWDKGDNGNDYYEYDDNDDLEHDEIFPKDSQEMTKRELKAVLKLYGSLWFRRTWILQEVSLAGETPLVPWGGGQINSKNLMVLANELLRSEMFSGSFRFEGQYPVESLETLNAMLYRLHDACYHVCAVVSAIWETCQAFNARGGDSLSMGLLIEKTTSSLVSDPRDKIYGILSVSIEQAQGDIPVEYDKPAEWIFSLVQNNHSNIRSGWPTWVSNFSKLSHQTARPLTQAFFKRNYIYKASGDLYLCHFDNDVPYYRRTLIGLRVDTVSLATEATEIPGANLQCLQNEEAFIPRLQHVVNLFHGNGNSGRVPNPDTRPNGLAYNPTPDDLSAAEEYGGALRDWIRRTLRAHHQNLWEPGSDATPLGHGDDQWDVDSSSNVPFEVLGLSHREKLLRRLCHIMVDHKAFWTSHEWIGFGPQLMEPGDVVAVLASGDVTFILREDRNRPGCFFVVGECYVEGLIFEELFRGVLLNFEPEEGYGGTRVSRAGEERFGVEFPSG